MRNKIIRRLAAGTCGVCITYGLVAQVFQGKDVKTEAIQSWTVPAAAVETQAPVPQATPQPQTDSAYPNWYGGGYAQFGGRMGRGGRHGHHGDWYGGDSYDMAPYVDPYSWRSDETQFQQNAGSGSDDSAISSPQTTSGDPPTLAQFLSTLRCGGCRHGCLLINPRCMKGRSKAQSATLEYQQTYGG